MLRVFIVDDEIYIIEKMKRLIKWEELGLTLAGIATDGASAFEMICQERPEIIICDIRMPGYNGIELIDMLRNAHIEATWIIISGHKHFDYAIQALKHGVKDYLLKPINAQELNALLKRIVKDLNNPTNSTSVKELINNKRALFLPSVINRTLVPHTEFYLLNQEYETTFQYGIFQWIIIKIDWPVDDETNLTSQVFQEIINQISENLQGLFNNICFEFLLNTNDTEITAFLNYDISSLSSTKKNSVDKLIKTALKESIAILSNFCEPQITFSLGHQYTDFSENYKHFLETRNELRNRILLGFNRVLIVNPESPAINTLLQRVLDLPTRRSLINSIETLNLSEYESLLKKISREKIPALNGDASLFWCVYENIYQLFWDIAKRMDVQDEHIPSMDVLQEMMWKSTKPDALLECLTACTSRHFSNYFNLDRMQTSAPVAIAKKYIADHYAEKISLNDISALVYLHPVYFSLLFKKETGINFTDFVNEYRIDIAKGLLKELKYPISEIAEKVGISNARYFSQLFRKHVGVTPKTYRNIHTSKQDNLPS